MEPTDVCATCGHARSVHVNQEKGCLFCNRACKEFVLKQPEPQQPLFDWDWAGNGWRLK